MENQTNNEAVLTVPYIVHRDAMADNRWVIKRITIALIVAVVLMFVSNGLWLYAWLQYDYSTVGDEVIADVNSAGDGVANFTGGNGGVIYGEGYGDTPDLEANTN